VTNYIFTSVRESGYVVGAICQSVCLQIIQKVTIWVIWWN